MRGPRGPRVDGPAGSQPFWTLGPGELGSHRAGANNHSQVSGPANRLGEQEINRTSCSSFTSHCATNLCRHNRPDIWGQGCSTGSSSVTTLAPGSCDWLRR